MRLTPAKVDDLVRQIMESLKHAEGVTVVNENRAAAIVRDVILEDLKREDALEDEARAVLRKHANQIHGDNLDYNLLFQRTKKQLAKEKGIIL